MKNNKTNIAKIKALAKVNGGIITPSLAETNGVHRAMLSYYLEKGLLERASRGVYLLQETWEDEMWILQNKFKRGIFSGNTALYLHRLTDQTPLRYEMTFPASYNLSKVKKDDRVCTCQHLPTFYDDGIVKLKTTFGNDVNVYCAEKVLCAMLRKRYHADIQIVANAFKMYTQGSNLNLQFLTHYGEVFHVEKQLRSYLEVLI